MKKARLLLLLVSFGFSSIFAQQEKGIVGSNNWLLGWSSFKPNKVDYNETTKILQGKISTNYTLTSSETYLLLGKVYVTNGAVLTIEAGTVIRGDFDSGGILVIAKGAKIIAEGIQSNPIVFTSNKPLSERKAGDWGGIIIMGDAPINSIGGTANLKADIDLEYRSYGGNGIENNAGSLKYVRIEFAGKPTQGYKEFNSLTLAGVGNKTKMEYVDISLSNGGSFKFFGGIITTNNLVSYRCKEDDFSFTQGVQCTISNCLAMRNPLISGMNSNRSFKLSANESLENVDFSKKSTSISATNLTLLNETVASGGTDGLVKEAIYIGDASCSLTMKNSVISGFVPAVLLNTSIEIKNDNLKKINFLGTLINLCNGNIQSEIGGTANLDLEQWYASANFGNTYSQTLPADIFIEPKNDKIPDLRLKINQIK